MIIPPPSTATAIIAKAALENEHQCVAAASGIDTSTSSDNQRSGPRRPPPLDLVTSNFLSCTCGESLCGSDCHFLQQELKAFEAAAREGARQRIRQRRDSNASANSEDQQRQFEEEDDAIADLERRFRRHFSSAAGFDDTCVDDIFAAGPNDDETFPFERMSLRRTKSCGVHSAELDQEHLRLRPNSYRMRIGYQDEALRERCEQNTQALLQRAVSDDSDATSTTTILARKALRYRMILKRMEDVDITDPSLDVHWQREGPSE